MRVEVLGWRKFSHASHPKDLDVHRATFATPDLTVSCRLDELGLVAVGQRLEPDRVVIGCRGCGSQVFSRGTTTRRRAHEPFGRRPTMLLARVRRYKCAGCGRG